MIFSVEEEILNLAEKYKKCISKIYNVHKIKIPQTINDDNYKYFYNFYIKLKKKDNFNGLFDMYNFLKAQGKVLYPAQLTTKKAEENFINYLIRIENEEKIKEKKIDEIDEEIQETLKFLESLNIKYEDIFNIYENEKSLISKGLFFVFTEKITKYLYAFDENFIKAFEKMPVDYQKTYELYLNKATELRIYLKENRKEIYKFLYELNKILKG